MSALSPVASGDPHSARRTWNLGRVWLALLEFVAIFGYIALALMAGRERPD